MKTQAKSKSGRTAVMLLGTLAVAALGGMLAFGTLYYSQKSASAEPAIPAGANLSSWFDNGAGGRRVLRVFRGSAPPEGTRVAGTVLTDTNCEPDPEGLSHCHNIIDLGNGRRIEVVNTHIMSTHPCLSPGQRITVARLNAEWVIATDPRRVN